MTAGGTVAGRQPAARSGLAVLTAVSAALVLADAAWMIVRFGGAEVTGFVDGVGAIAAGVVGTVFTARRARAESEGGDRAGWLILSISCAAFVAGVLIAVAYVVVTGVGPPVPSPADVPYIADNVLGLLGVLFLGGQLWGGSRVRLLLDGGIAACAILLLSWLTALHAVYQAGGHGFLSFAVGLAYPIGDVVTVVIVLAVVSHSRRLNPALLIVALGMVLFAFSDSAFAYLHYVRPNLLDDGYVAGYLLIGIASLTAREARDPAGEVRLTRLQIALPYIPLALAGITVLVAVSRDRPLDLLTKVLVAAMLLFVLARQLTAVAEAQSLTTRLATALREQQILIEQAPVGICRLDREGVLISANRNLATMLGVRPEALPGRSFLDFVHPDDTEAGVRGLIELQTQQLERVDVEIRGMRPDGSTLWCAATVGPLRGPDGRMERTVAVVEDITERKWQADRAARIQRGLFPQETPRIEGYELAGACRAALEVAGDFYDWVVTDDGRLDVTLADVMGKGVAAALIMAVLRTALHSAPQPLGPAARVRIAADSLHAGMKDDGLFVTLFQCRLDPTTGMLCYVDAGHGHCAIWRPDGRLDALPHRSLPVGVEDAAVFHEGAARLEPGDALILYSDGLVETEERTLQLGELTGSFDQSAGAAEIVNGLMESTPAKPADDVTVVVLRRLPETQTVRSERPARGPAARSAMTSDQRPETSTSAP